MNYWRMLIMIVMLLSVMCLSSEAGLWMDWSSLTNPVLKYNTWAIKDYGIAYNNGTYYLFFSAFYEDDGRIRSHVVEVSTADFKTFSQPILHFDGQEEDWIGMCSPDCTKVGDTWYLTFNSWGDKSGKPNQLFYKTSTDLVTWSSGYSPLASNLTNGTRAIDAAIAYANNKFYLYYKRDQETHCAVGSTINGNFSHIGGDGHPSFKRSDGSTGDWHENYQLLKIDNKWRILTTSDGLNPYLYTMQNSGSADNDWKTWISGYRLNISRESWNIDLRDNATCILNLKALDGWYYAFYAGVPDGYGDHYDGRGWCQLGMSRSQNLTNWYVAGTTGTEIWNPVTPDTTAPVVSNYRVWEQTNGIKLRVTCTDDFGLASIKGRCVVTSSTACGNPAYDTTMTSIGGGDYQAVLPYPPGGGEFVVKCHVTDNNGNISNKRVPGYGPWNGAPCLSNPVITPASLSPYGGTVTLRVDAAGNVNLSTVKAVVTDPNRNDTTITLTRTSGTAASGTYTGHYTTPFANYGDSPSVYGVTFQGTNAENKTASLASSFSVTNSPAPSLASQGVSPASLPPGGGWVAVNVYASCPQDISAVQATVYDPFGGNQTIPMALTGGTAQGGWWTGYYNAVSANTGEAPQAYSVLYTAWNVFGKWNQAWSSFQVQNATIPVLSGFSAQPGNVPCGGGTVNLSITASGDYDITSVRALVTSPTGVQSNIDLILAAGNSISGVWTGSYNCSYNYTGVDVSCPITFTATNAYTRSAQASAAFTVGHSPDYTAESAKRQTSGVYMRLIAVPVSAAFSDCFYVQQGVSGIKIRIPGHSIRERQLVSVFGILRATADGERYVEALHVW